VTVEQFKAIEQLAVSLDVPGEEILRMARETVRRPIEKITDLTGEEADRIIKALTALNRDKGENKC
jgi:hypothetical protein